MSLITRATDSVYTFRFLALLVTPWNETEAYKLGIVDENGKILKRTSELRTDQEKSAYTYFHRLVYNVKRLINRVPGGQSKIASYAAALYLIKENFPLSDQHFEWVFNNADLDVSVDLNESLWMVNAEGHLLPGKYKLTHDALLDGIGEARAVAGTTVTVSESLAPIDVVLGIPVFVVHHDATEHNVVIALTDITR